MATKLTKDEWNLLLKIVHAGLKSSTIRRKNLNEYEVNVMMEKIYDWQWSR